MATQRRERERERERESRWRDRWLLVISIKYMDKRCLETIA